MATSGSFAAGSRWHFYDEWLSPTQMASTWAEQRMVQRRERPGLWSGGGGGAAESRGAQTPEGRLPSSEGGAAGCEGALTWDEGSEGDRAPARPGRLGPGIWGGGGAAEDLGIREDGAPRGRADLWAGLLCALTTWASARDSATFPGPTACPQRHRGHGLWRESGGVALGPRGPSGSHAGLFPAHQATGQQGGRLRPLCVLLGSPRHPVFQRLCLEPRSPGLSSPCPSVGRDLREALCPTQMESWRAPGSPRCPKWAPPPPRAALFGAAFLWL